MAAAAALRDIADWAEHKPGAAALLAQQMLALGLDLLADLSEAQEYELITFCLHQPEQTIDWLTRVAQAHTARSRRLRRSG